MCSWTIQVAVAECLAQLLRPLIDQQLSIVFCELATLCTKGLSQQDGEVRHFGMSKRDMAARQFYAT